MKKILLSILACLLIVLGVVIVTNGMDLFGMEILGISRNPRKKFQVR